jgi:hypothetical protein
MAPTGASPLLNVGFLTILRESNGYLGGYLVTNQWGRPLEFRLSTAVQPNRVHQILYAGTLEPYLCADLIGKTLVEKCATAVQLVVTDTETVLDLRHKVDCPVVWVGRAEPAASSTTALPVRTGARTVYSHPRFGEDVPRLQEMLERLGGSLDLAEPFQRIREAIGEARKMGVTSRG